MGTNSYIPSTNYCRVCNGAHLGINWPVKSNADGVLSDNYSLWVCANCGAGHTTPEPTPDMIGRYYEQGIYKQSGGRAGKLIDTILSRLADWRLAGIHRVVGASSGRLLDVGCGKGRFLARAANHGWQAQGTDVATGQLLAVAERYGLKAFHGEVWEAEFPANSFDVITAWHVLEHLHDPHKVTAEVARILKAGGFFVFETPNFASWQAKIGRENWFQLDVPRHLIHYTPTAVEHLLRQHGFEIIAVHTFAIELGIFGMLQSLLNRIGLAPNSLFRWLKRSEQLPVHWILANILLATLLFLPAVALELVASLTKAGGVIRVVAKEI